MTQDEILAQKASWENDYISEDGLMRLSYDTFRDPYPGQTLKTVPNDNGILFVTYYYYLLAAHNCLETKDSQRFYDTVKRLESNHIKGLYNRNPGRISDYEALDNYVAIVAGGALFDFPFPRDVCDFGDQNGYLFNNLNREQTYFPTFRQGAEIAFYQLCSGRMPMLWNLIWFYGSFVVSAFYKSSKTSEHLCTWLRLRAIERAYERLKGNGLWFEWAYGLTFIFGWIWRRGLLKNTDGLGIERELSMYFGNPLHPNHVLSEGIKY